MDKHLCKINLTLCQFPINLLINKDSQHRDGMAIKLPYSYWIYNSGKWKSKPWRNLQKVGVKARNHDTDTKTDIRSQPHTVYAWEKQLPYPLMWRLCVSHSNQCREDKKVSICYNWAI